MIRPRREPRPTHRPTKARPIQNFRPIRTWYDQEENQVVLWPVQLPWLRQGLPSCPPRRGGWLALPRGPRAQCTWDVFLIFELAGKSRPCQDCYTWTVWPPHSWSLRLSKQRRGCYSPCGLPCLALERGSGREYFLLKESFSNRKKISTSVFSAVTSASLPSARTTRMLKIFSAP